MAGNRSAGLVALERRIRAARMRVAGMSEREIAAKLGVGASTVRRDLELALRDQNWQAVCEAREARKAAMAKVDQIEHALWEAWERSCGDQRPGNVACMTALLKCVQRRAALLRLDEPAPPVLTMRDCDCAWRDLAAKAGEPESADCESARGDEVETIAAPAAA
jgi:hypothetical protein